jgi:phosphotransferase system enzyme I (PtsP)
MSPASIGPVKAMLGTLDVGELNAQLTDAIDNHGDTGSLRHVLNKFAERTGVPL